jgi:uncharacterized MAPEG superfamily protein
VVDALEIEMRAALVVRASAMRIIVPVRRLYPSRRRHPTFGAVPESNSDAGLARDRRIALRGRTTPRRAAMLEPYGSALVAYLVLGILFLVQIVMVDVASIRAGHVPGTAVAGGHDDFLFRAVRAHANTNENLAAFLVLSLAAMLLGANPWWTNGLVGTFVLARAAHMLMYYLDLRMARSAAFAAGLLCLVGLAIVAIGVVL